MRVARIVIKNFRTFQRLDVNVENDLCCIIGENNTGKTAILRAIQICLDISLPSTLRSLLREDINANVDISTPTQVLIGVELTGFEGIVNEEALVSTWKTGADRARIFYRFRPKPGVREQLASSTIQPGSLTLDDYAWEIRGGGNPAIDLLDLEWNEDGVGEAVRFADLQSFLVIHLPALRDVEGDLRNPRQSPLIKLIESFEIPKEEQEELIQILDEANNLIAKSKTISHVAQAIDSRFKDVSGPAFEMGAKLGLSAATFRAILRNLKLILSDTSLQEFEPGRNGLGMNNILYISILIEYLKRRIAGGNSSGQLILIEEPEAHLHPQLQYSLISALNSIGVQTVLTSHSTHVTSQVPLKTIVSLTKRGDASIAAGNLALNAKLTSGEISDLERYLDSTKSSLLYARKVMLVEGAAELFLIPALIESVHKVKLERVGISLTAIHGVHFDVYAKLFAHGSLEKKCAIVADADLIPSDASALDFNPDDSAPDLMALENDFVQVFLGATTFERELTTKGLLPMHIAAAEALGAPRIREALSSGYAKLCSGSLPLDDEVKLRVELGGAVLNTAKRFGKARYAQVAARFADRANELPEYIQQAFEWLSE
ncbi:putative ATP-dependent endonuclease of OLD family [Rhizobium sp. SJZ105]|uniref:ATP-dependent nuclease n=1 Tax=Rhizobium sp. SJZ105 TaxID=2572678 RepID=UPI00119F3278|nr:AAA family ATPase [Rhizobium sp. SJZ105]TWC77314.1 putative ATP-dependent endonuclease of OLD family [Rhizobium sp. SJZ105]